MKKALACTLSLALLLSLTACHRPQADQPDASQPDPATTSSQADATTPEPEPPATPAPAQLSDTAPAAPAENEDPQHQSEPAAQEPAETEPVSEPVQPETPPVTAENPPAETKPAEQAQEQQPPAEQPPEAQQTEEQKTIDQMIADSQRRAEEARQAREAKGSGVTLEEAQKNLCDGAGHPLNEILTLRPNEAQTPTVAKKMMEANRNCGGNGYAWIIRSPTTLAPEALLPVPYELVRPWLDSSGQLWYSVIHPFTGAPMTIHRMDMIHLMAYTHNGYTAAASDQKRVLHNGQDHQTQGRDGPLHRG